MLTAVFGFWLLEGRVLHKGAWVVTLLGTLLGVEFPGRDNSSLVVKGLNRKVCLPKIVSFNTTR